MARWDPQQYLAFSDERSRPFSDLLSRVAGPRPARVVDLGCGTGRLTATLAELWPEAEVVGIDSSPEMLSAAAPYAERYPNLAFVLQSIDDWEPDPGIDLIVSNAALQWVPGHRDLLRSWLPRLRTGARVAVQVPGNEDSPSQIVLRELAGRPEWAAALSDVGADIPRVGGVRDYLDIFLEAGHRVEAWETTYQHVLTGEDAVLDWLEGTRLLAYRQRLGSRADAFVAELRPLLREAYPPAHGATVFGFRRLFFVGTIG